MGCALRTSGNANPFVFTRTSGTWDFSSTHLYIWFYSTIGKFITTLEVRVGASTNYGYWTIPGGYQGGWQCIVIDTSRSFDRNSGTAPNKAAINSVGINLVLNGAPRNIANTWVDVMRFGNGGLTVTGGTSGDPGTWAQILAEDASTTAGKAYGVITKQGGAYVLQGPITFGSTTAGVATYFKDTSQVIMFDDQPVSSTLYEIKVQGNATGTTKVYFGTKSGSNGISGCFFKSVGTTAKFKLTATDSNITDLGLYGCNFVNAATISLPTYSATREALNCAFEACAEVLASTCTLTYCNFVSSASYAVQIASASHNLTYCNFINCSTGIEQTVNSVTFTGCGFSSSGTGHAIEVKAGTGTNNLSGCTFTGYTAGSTTAAYYNTGNGTLTVNVSNGANPTTYSTGTGSVTLVSSVSLTVDANVSLNGAEIRVYDLDNSPAGSLGTELAGYESNSGATFSYTGAPGNVVWLQIMKSGYEEFGQQITLPSVNGNFTALLKQETNA
jgi:hypothetical protein